MRAAAPLKRGVPEPDDARGAGYPRHACRGPIEAAQSASSEGALLLPIRGMRAAAPLKLRLERDQLREPNRYPRHACRGPIEAECGGGHRSARSGYPRHACRGPIEATRAATCCGR